MVEIYDDVPDPEVIRRIRCTSCGRGLQYLKSDVKQIKVNTDYLGDFDTAYAIECPGCNEKVRVKPW